MSDIKSPEVATAENRDAIQAEISSQYNNGGDFFSTTVDGVDYEVQFEFQTKIIDGKDVDGKLVEGGYSNLNAENNFFEIINSPKNNNGLGGTVTGEDKNGSRGGNTGFIKTSEVSTPTVSHELNHSFGGKNKDSRRVLKTSENDIAVQSKNSLDPASRKVTQGNIDDIFRNISFKSGNKANVGNPRPQLYDNNTGESRTVDPK